MSLALKWQMWLKDDQAITRKTATDLDNTAAAFERIEMHLVKVLKKKKKEKEKDTAVPWCMCVTWLCWLQFT